jgi:rhodanese-related sulfurtransferase
MSKKLHILTLAILLLSLLLGACAAPAADPEVTTAPVVVEPTAVPTEVPTEVPTAEPTPTPEPVLDAQAVVADMMANFSPDNGFNAINAAKLNELLADKPPVLVDLREASEIEADGYIAGAINIPVRDLLKNLDKLPGLDEPVVVYCASGHRGGLALAALYSLGYTNVKSLGGGTGAWLKAGFPVETGSVPAAAESLSTPIVEDQTLFNAWDEFLTNLPEGFYAAKSDKVNEMLTAGEMPFLLDVRTAEEWAKDGYIEGAVNIPFNDLLANADQLPAPDQPIVIYCGSGHRGAIVLAGLKLLGYENVTNLAGGLNAWKAAQFPVSGWVNWPGVWGEYLASMPDDYYTVKADVLNTELVENPPFLLDVRETSEVEESHIEGAVNIPVRDVLKNLDKLPAQDQPIVIYCASGHRGALAMAALQHLGYTNVRNLAGGLGAWTKAELPVVPGPAAEAVAGTAPEVDATRLRDLDAFLSSLPEGFYTVKAADLNASLAGGSAPAIIDVRTAEEYAEGYIEGSLNIPIKDLLVDMTLLPADKAAPLTVLCASGHRGAIGMMALRMIGYQDVTNLAGGMNAWVAAELPVAK